MLNRDNLVLGSGMKVELPRFKPTSSPKLHIMDVGLLPFLRLEAYERDEWEPMTQLVMI